MTSATRTTVAAKIPGLTGGDYILEVRSGSLELNEGRVPYGRLELVAALPETSILNQVTPYGSLRVQGTITQEWEYPVRAPQTRTFDMLLHERSIDHVAATLTVIAMTDEAMLLDRLNVSTALARTYGLSVKTVCEYALTQIGATLEAGAVDATLTSKALSPSVVNLIPNPSIEVNTTGWTAPSGSQTLARTTSEHLYGSASISSTASGSTTIGIYNGAGSAGGQPGTPGVSYTWSFYVKGTVTRTGRALIRFLNSSNVQVGTDTQVDLTITGGAGWQRMSVTAVAPAGTAWVSYYGALISAASGNVAYFDGMMLTASADLLPYFDGGTFPATGYEAGLWGVSWTGTAHQSASTLANLPNTDATIWQPGQSLDDWLEPILQAANRRLFCDEHRKWRLVDSGYSFGGTVTVSEGYNAKSGSDLMSRQKTELGVPVWFDHVSVHYEWKDSLGVTQQAWDFASSGTVRGYPVEKSTPWPGPGAAASILARAAGRGRTQDLVALTDYLATPGMAIVSTLPGTPIQSGVLSAVTWRWDDGVDEMRVTSRGLTDTPANAWIFAAGAWSAATGSWAAATGTN